MSENWKGTESQLFAEFVEHREMLMIMRKWWRPGYLISFCYLHESEATDAGPFCVKIKKVRVQGVQSWESTGLGKTLDEAAKTAAAQAAFRD